MTKQILFLRSGETFRPDGTTVEAVSIRALVGRLPDGMRARYDVVREADGNESVSGYFQARSKNGRRYFFEWGADAALQADKRILAWANRILREIDREDLAREAWRNYSSALRSAA